MAQGGGDQADGTNEEPGGRAPRLEGGLLAGHPSCLWDAKGMQPGASGAQEVKVRAGSDVWGITSISVIADPRERAELRVGSPEQGTVLKEGWEMTL